MAFWKKNNPHEQYDERYTRRPVRERREEPLLWVHLGFLTVLGVIAMGAVWSMSGLPMLQDSLKALATPVGLLWLMLLAGIWFSCIFRQARTAILLFLVWMVLTAGGNAWIKDRLVRSLEDRWIGSLKEFEQSSEEATFDLIVVLGGGTSTNPDFKPQLNPAGDRVMTAAQLFHRGQAKRICVTGEQQFRSVAEDLDPAEEARDLLIDIGVPAESIIALRGRNTSEEMRALKTWLDQQPESGTWKIGLVTSAWHMTRAMGLAGANGIQGIHAVPADWRSSPWTASPDIVIPSASNLDTTSRMLHEYLGRLVGR